MKYCFLFLILAVLIAGCDAFVGTEPFGFSPEIVSLRAPAFSIEPAASCTLTVVTYSSDSSRLNISWTATGGTCSPTTGNTITWTAPVDTGEYRVTCSISDRHGSDKAIVRLIVSETLRYLRAPETLLVEAGPFLMGDSLDEGDADEVPLHTVYVDAFEIGMFEVSNHIYRDFIEYGGYDNPELWSAGGFGRWEEPGKWDDQRFNQYYLPVVAVSWYEAMAYCSWLSMVTGDHYRLPTEAEWEKAASGTGQKSRYPWNWNDIDGHMANFSDSGDPFDNGTTPVGYYSGYSYNYFFTMNNASPYGAFDMAGNAWEWCLDWYAEDYYEYSASDNPQGPSSGEYRVLRGGSWDSPPWELRNANRESAVPLERFDYFGFRVVREVQ